MINMKVAPNDIIYPSVICHIFSRTLTIFLDLITFLRYWKSLKDKSKPFSISYQVELANLLRCSYPLRCLSTRPNPLPFQPTWQRLISPLSLRLTPSDRGKSSPIPCRPGFAPTAIACCRDSRARRIPSTVHSHAPPPACRVPLATWPPLNCLLPRRISTTARTTSIWTRSAPTSAPFSTGSPCHPIHFHPGLPPLHLDSHPSPPRLAEPSIPLWTRGK
jgi:hypothetical protein